MKKEKMQVIVCGDIDSCQNLLPEIRTEGTINSQYEVIAGCTMDDVWLHGAFMGHYLDDIPIISPNEVVDICKNNKNSLIVTTSNGDNLFEYFEYFKQQGVDYVVPSIFLIGHMLSMRDYINSLAHFNENDSALVLCSPLKTGNNTIATTLVNNNITHIGLVHFCARYRFFNKYKKMKVIVAVREPIIQGLSLIFQELASSGKNSFSLTVRNSFKTKEDFTSSVNNIYPILSQYIKEISVPGNI